MTRIRLDPSLDVFPRAQFFGIIAKWIEVTQWALATPTPQRPVGIMEPELIDRQECSQLRAPLPRSDVIELRAGDDRVPPRLPPQRLRKRRRVLGSPTASEQILWRHLSGCLASGFGASSGHWTQMVRNQLTGMQNLPPNGVRLRPRSTKLATMAGDFMGPVFASSKRSWQIDDLVKVSCRYVHLSQRVDD